MTSPLFTDLYQLTMAQAYFVEGLRGEAVFDLFVRRLRRRNYLIACGLESILAVLESLRFKPDELAYLEGLGVFRGDFLEHLEGWRFSGDVHAVPEGTPVFADEPLVEVVAPIGEAQLAETVLLNQITFQTNVATKAHRVVQAARGRTVVDFGMRRMHGTDAALKAARACYVAGVQMTSNVLAGMTYDIPVTGTMAHSYVEAHDSEADAFRAFAALYPDTTLLVDTYDTLDGVRRVIHLAATLGDAFRPGAIRLDSGHLGDLARDARALLDEAGLGHVKIFASNSLDEFAVDDLLLRGAPIDGFGVGTRLGTINDLPYLDSVYKLCAYDGIPRMKLSARKSTLPGRKQVYRRFDDDGRMEGDVIALFDEASPGEPLLQPVMRSGRRTEAGRPRSLADVRADAARSLTALPDGLLSFDEVEPPYPVDLSPGLEEALESTRRQTMGG